MDVKRSIFLIFTFLIAFPSSITYSMVIYNDTQSAGEFIVKVGVVTAVVGAVTCFCGWLFGQSHDNVLNQARNDYDSVRTRYDNYLIVLERLLQEKSTTNRFNYEESIALAQEPFLYTFSVNVWDKTHSLIKDFDVLPRNISSIVSHKQTLTASITSLRKKKNDHSAMNLMREMQALVLNIDNWLSRISLLRDCAKYHESYFVLFEYEAEARARYRGEFDVMANYPHDRYVIIQEIKRSIMLKQTQKNSLYPYIEYINGLNRDIRDFTVCLQNAAYNYSERINWARKVVTCLEYIKDLVIIDDEYIKELRLQEKNRIEKEHIERMKERDRIERKKLIAMEEQNRIERKKLLQKEREQLRRNETFADIVIKFP